MTKEELIQFLKENLKVKVNRVYNACQFLNNSEYLRVELYLGNERINWDEMKIT